VRASDPVEQSEGKRRRFRVAGDAVGQRLLVTSVFEGDL
jgi:hypothetical protein